MRKIYGDLWDYYNKGYDICIPVNGCQKSNGHAIMGKGIALQATRRFPELPMILGRYMREYGWNGVYEIRDRIWTFPTKPEWGSDISLDKYGHAIPCRVPGWRLKAAPVLIKSSLVILNSLYAARETHDPFDPFILPMPGCGCGGLDWQNVKPLCEKYGDWLWIIDRGEPK